MANFGELKKALKLCYAAGITPFIMGDHGVGKSSLVKEFAAEDNMGCIDMRCSLLESSELIGLPDKENGYTVYRPPAMLPVGDMKFEDVKKQLDQYWPKLNDNNEYDLIELHRYKQKFVELQPRYERGVLFLDEINRAADDVLQASFQLILDKRIGMWCLPPGWMVIAAGNYTTGQYRCSRFVNDPAFVDRFCHLTFSCGEEIIEDWVGYMARTHGGEAANVIDFTTQNLKHLHVKSEGERGFNVTPSPRSWDRVVEVLKSAAKINADEATVHTVLCGIIGLDMANTFRKHNSPVKPLDLIKDGIDRHKSKIRTLERNQLIGLSWGLVSYCKDKKDDPKYGKLCLDFADCLYDSNSVDKDCVVGFLNALVDGSASRANAALISNPALTKMIAEMHKKQGKYEFIDMLAERPKLQQLIKESIWSEQ